MERDGALYDDLLSYHKTISELLGKNTTTSRGIVEFPHLPSGGSSVFSDHLSLCLP
jgi:hypothetical protein